MMTAHCSTNPGASLQSHALYKKLAELGHEPVIIDYRPPFFTDFMDARKVAHYRGRDRLKMLLLGSRLQEKHDKFLAFENKYYPRKTRRYDSAAQLKSDHPRMDAYLCGSDQIWNPCHIQYDPSYFCDFAQGQKIYSYAASIGQDRLAEKDLAFLAEQTTHFQAISVREDSALSIMHSLGRDAAQHIDPTLFYGGEYWRSIATPVVQKLPPRYILYYPLQNDPIELALIQMLKRHTGLPCVAAESALRKTKGTDIQVTACSPVEFIWLIDHAETIITNSFHGILFSILLNKHVIPYKNPERNSRIESLLRLLHLEGLQTDLVDDYLTKDWKGYWDRFIAASEVLESERSRAEQYLREVFS